MWVLSLLFCIIVLASQTSGQAWKKRSTVIPTTSNKYLASVTGKATSRTKILNLADKISSTTEAYVSSITNANEDDPFTVSRTTPSTISADDCLPGYSGFNKKDIRSVVDTFLAHYIKNHVNESFYPRALQVREKYIDQLKIFEKRFEDRPLHLKHILQDMALTRQRIEPMVKSTASLLSQFQTYENTFRTTEERVNRTLENVHNSNIICNLNCGHDQFETLITMTSSRRYLKYNQIHCSTIADLLNTVEERLKKFYIVCSDKLDARIYKDSVIFEGKVKNIKNKLKTAAVEQFGLTMYEILNLQDEYYHFSIDIQQYNISYVLQDIKHNEYEVNSKLLDLERKAKIYRDYCNSCNDQLLNSVQTTPQRLARAVEIEAETLLDEVLREATNDTQILIDRQYEIVFEELNRKLEETTIIEVHLAKLKPIQGEIDNDVKKEMELFSHLQSLVPKETIAEVFKLVNKSKSLLQRVDDGLFSIRQRIEKT